MLKNDWFTLNRFKLKKSIEKISNRLLIKHEYTIALRDK